MALLSRADTSSVAAGPHALRCFAIRLCLRNACNKECHCGLYQDAQNRDTRRTPNPLRVGPRNNTTLTPNIKRFLLDLNQTSYNKTSSRFFSLRLQVSFTLEDVRFGEICLRLATNMPIGMQLAIIHNPSS